MKSVTRPRVLVGSTVLFVVAAVGAALSWDPVTPEPAPDVAADTITAAELGSAAEHTVFFGHMSVGNNVLNGIERVYQRKNAAVPEVIQINGSDPAARLPSGGGIVHALIGQNGDPKDKLANFDAAMRGGLAKHVDVALLKFCYVDVTADTDVEGLFRTYREVLAALERDFPDVRFLHSTVPLTTAPSGIKANLKALLRGVDNPNRERYNALVRASYGSNEVFDIATIESTSPTGDQASSLYPGYTSDGEHLNASGSSLAAVAFLRLVGAGSPE